jgi:hypothetical protein
MLSRIAVCVLLSTHLAGCGVWERYVSRSSNDAAADRAAKKAVARGRVYAEQAAVVGRVGAKVCRTLELGIGVPDTVRGTVTEVDGERISVRIDDAGILDHTIEGRVVAKGAVVSDSMKFWLPCL